MILTQEELEKHGYCRFSWNDGAIVEYWKSFRKTGDFDYRVGVRFGEYRNTPFTVWLILPSFMYSLRHLTTVEQVEQLLTLLSE